MEFLEKLGGRRLLAELMQIFKEKEPLKGVGRMASLGLLRFIHPELELSLTLQEMLEDARSMVSWYDLLYLEHPYERWAVYFLVLCDALNDEQFWNTCTRLAVSEHFKEKLVEMRRQGTLLVANLERKAASQERLENSEIYFFLRGLPVEVLLYQMAKSRNAEIRRCISLYFTKLQGVRPLIGGDDLKGLGLATGPRYREILDAVLSARLDGRVTSREDEVALVQNLVAPV